MIKILGDRVLVSKLDEVKEEGFQTVDVKDTSFSQGKVVAISEDNCSEFTENLLNKTIVFVKHSPDTHDYEDMKIISVEDILGVLD